MSTHSSAADRASGENPEQRHGLFRKQAVDKQQDRLLGDVLVVPPISYSIVTLVILVFVAAAVALLINGSYARKETVQGFLVPDQGAIKVFADRAGIIREVFVQEGDVVEQGQALVLINGDRILESGEHLEALLLTEYAEQQKLLNAQLQRLPQRYENKQAEYRQALISTKSDVAHLSAQQGLLAEQIKLTEQQQNNLQTLRENNLASSADANALKEKMIGLQGQEQELDRNLAAQKNQLKTLALQQAALEFEHLNVQENLQSSLSSINQNVAQLHGQRAFIVKANKAGTVSNVQFSAGQEANTQIPLLTITPEGSQLEAELLVPARAIGFVEAGQSVKLRYSAFNFQKFGLYSATISEVTNSVLLPQEINGLAVPVQEPMYRITAKLAQQTVDAYGKALPLKAGISLEADIKLAERTLLEWMLEPLLSLKGRV